MLLSQERRRKTEPPAGNPDAFCLIGNGDVFELAQKVLTLCADDAHAVVAVDGFVNDLAERLKDALVEIPGGLATLCGHRIRPVFKRVGHAILADTVRALRHQSERHVPGVLAVHPGTPFMRQRHVDVERLACASTQNSSEGRDTDPRGNVIRVVHVPDDVETGKEVRGPSIVILVIETGRCPRAVVSTVSCVRRELLAQFDHTVDPFLPPELPPIAVAEEALEGLGVTLIAWTLEISIPRTFDFAGRLPQLLFRSIRAILGEVLFMVFDEAGHAAVIHFVVKHDSVKRGRMAHGLDFAGHPAFTGLDVRLDVARQMKIVV